MATEENNDLQESGKILLQINNGVKNVSKWSKEEMIGGFKWCLNANVNKQNGETKMILSIGCNEDCCLGTLWMANVDILVEYQREKINSRNIYFFTGCNSIIYEFDVIPSKENVNLTANLNIDGSSSNKKMMALDTDLRFSIPKLDNPALNVEMDVPVNKYALAAISSYFQNLFFGNWSERSNNANSFTIKEEADFNVKTFKFMVYSAMSMGWMVHKSRILNATEPLPILKLSVKYDIPMMQKYCEQHLIQLADECPKMELLEVAEQLGIQKLKDHVLSTICPLDVSQDFGRNADIRARLSEPTRRQLDKRMADKTEELRNELVKKRKIVKFLDP